jgi:subtilisin family serine protease
MGRGRTLAAAFAATAAAILAAAGVAAAQDDLPRFAAGELIVRFEAGTDRAQQAAVREELGASLVERLLLDRAQVVELGAGESVLEAARAFERRPEVSYAEPNFLYELDGVPNDPLSFEQAGLHDTGQTFGDLDQVPPSYLGTYDADIDAPEAWNITTGSTQTTIAIVDSGVDYTHPDLAQNMVPGHDFAADNSGADDGDPFPHGSDHGTHVAGIAGAIGNNGEGVAGVSWYSKLMPLKVSRPNGVIMASDVVDAFTHASSQGVRLVNASLTGPDMSSALRDAIDAAPETLFVVSAGNDSENVDDLLVMQFPCEHTAPNIICVTSTNHNDQFASSFANYGPVSADLAAPGASILSTEFAASFTYTGPYDFKSGTSMSAPMVTGTAALLFGLNPGASVAEIKGAILNTVDPLPSLAGITATGGRLNVKSALGGVGELDVETVITTGLPKKKTRKKRVRFSFDSPTHKPASFLCQIDKKGFEPCSAIAKYGVRRGRHTFAVKAIDLIGREDPTPATQKFKVKRRKKK